MVWFLIYRGWTTKNWWWSFMNGQQLIAKIEVSIHLKAPVSIKSTASTKLGTQFRKASGIWFSSPAILMPWTQVKNSCKKCRCLTEWKNKYENYSRSNLSPLARNVANSETKRQTLPISTGNFPMLIFKRTLANAGFFRISYLPSLLVLSVPQVCCVQ